MGEKLSKLARGDASGDIDVIAAADDQRKAVVLEKILQNPVYNERLSQDAKMLDKFATILCDKEQLKKTYLSTDWVETIKLYNTIREGVNEMDRASSAHLSTTGTTGAFSSQSSNAETLGDVAAMRVSQASKDVGDDSRDNDNNNSDNDDHDDDEFDESHIHQAAMFRGQKLKNKIKVKIVVAEVAHTQIRRSFRRLVSPVLSMFDLLPEFGMFHSALMIGPWLIEWNNSSLCVPRKCVSKAALIMADIDAIETSTQVEEVVDILSEAIVHWNTTKYYKDHSGNPAKEGNCQDFVEDIMNRLGLQLNTTGPLAQFLKNLRTKGKCDMEFSMDSVFQKKFNIGEKTKVFRTHEELDQFANDLLKIDPEFDQHYRNEWAMLKSFDRALWLRHYKFKEDKRWAPLKKSVQDSDGDTVMELDCPWDDPTLTFSIRHGDM